MIRNYKPAPMLGQDLGGQKHGKNGLRNAPAAPLIYNSTQDSKDNTTVSMKLKEPNMSGDYK